MADVFQLGDELVEQRTRLWDLIRATPHLTWQLLTKRPENVLRMVPIMWMTDGWPENIWLGTTAEDQTRANLRVPRLLGVDGVAVRFLSCEPLLEEVDINEIELEPKEDPTACGYPEHCYPWERATCVDWVICGASRGPGHRPMELVWRVACATTCHHAYTPFFFKQHGGRTPKAGGDLLDGWTWKDSDALNWDTAQRLKESQFRKDHEREQHGGPRAEGGLHSRPASELVGERYREFLEQAWGRVPMAKWRDNGASRTAPCDTPAEAIPVTTTTAGTTCEGRAGSVCAS